LHFLTDNPMKAKNSPMPSIHMDNSIADKLIAAHDGDLALLYIYAAATGYTDAEKAAVDLCRTLSEIKAAEEKLRRLGIFPQQEPSETPRSQPLPPPEELPEYRSEDILRRSREDADFAAVTGEAQKALGHVLSSSDLKKLFGIYDYLALPPEVILELINHCVSISQGRRPSMRFIEKEAYTWVNREIFTLEQAEEYIRRSRERREDMARLLDCLNIRGREPSPTEKKYLSAWLDMGFGEDCISAAYDRTLTNTGSLKWSYMNKILLSWHEKGIHCSADIAEKDSRPGRVQTGNAVRDSAVDMDALRKLVDKMRQD